MHKKRFLILSVILLLLLLLIFIFLFYREKIRTWYYLVNTPINRNYEKIEMYRGQYNGQTDHMYYKIYYSSDKFDNYRDKKGFVTISEQNKEYINMVIDSFEFNVKAYDNYPENNAKEIINNFTKPEVKEDDLYYIRLKKTSSRLSYSDPLKNDYYVMEMVYVSFSEQTAYYFKAFSFSFYDNEGKTNNSGRINFFSDINEFQTETEKCKNKSSTNELFEDFINSNNYFYVLTNPEELSLIHISVLNDSVDVMYTIDNPIITVCLGYTKAEDSDMSEEDYLNYCADMFSGNKKEYFEINGTKFLKIDTHSYYMFFWMNDGDYIRMLWKICDFEPKENQFQISKITW